MTTPRIRQGLNHQTSNVITIVMFNCTEKEISTKRTILYLYQTCVQWSKIYRGRTKTLSVNESTFLFAFRLGEIEEQGSAALLYLDRRLLNTASRLSFQSLAALTGNPLSPSLVSDIKTIKCRTHLVTPRSHVV